MRRFADLETHRAKRVLCAINRPSSDPALAAIVIDTPMSIFRWKADPHPPGGCARKHRLKIAGDESGLAGLRDWAGSRRISR
jgi:hypothetical protein